MSILHFELVLFTMVQLRGQQMRGRGRGNGTMMCFAVAPVEFEHPEPEHVDLEQERCVQDSERQDSERQESEPDEPKRVSDDGPQIELDGSEHCSAPPHLSGSFSERLLSLMCWFVVQLFKKLEWLGGKVVSIELRMCLIMMDEATCARLCFQAMDEWNLSVDRYYAERICKQHRGVLGFARKHAGVRFKYEPNAKLVALHTKVMVLDDIELHERWLSNSKRKKTCRQEWTAKMSVLEHTDAIYYELSAYRSRKQLLYQIELTEKELVRKDVPFMCVGDRPFFGR